MRKFPDSATQLPRIYWLRHIPLEACGEHFVVAVEMPVPRDDDDRNLRSLRRVPFDLIQQPQTVFAWHRHVRYDNIGHPRPEKREGLTSRCGGLNFRTGMYQRRGEDLPCVGIIIHDENPNAPEIGHARGSSLRHSADSVPDSFAVVEGLEGLR